MWYAPHRRMGFLGEDPPSLSDSDVEFNRLNEQQKEAVAAVEESEMIRYVYPYDAAEAQRNIVVLNAARDREPKKEVQSVLARQVGDEYARLKALTEKMRSVEKNLSAQWSKVAAVNAKKIADARVRGKLQLLKQVIAAENFPGSSFVDVSFSR
jgi:hypothetical protein